MAHTLGLMSQKNLVPQRAGWSGAISCFTNAGMVSRKAQPILRTALLRTAQVVWL